MFGLTHKNTSVTNQNGIGHIIYFSIRQVELLSSKFKKIYS